MIRRLDAERCRGYAPDSSLVGSGFYAAPPLDCTRGALSKVEGQAGRQGPPYDCDCTALVASIRVGTLGNSIGTRSRYA
jgi:hypothetical protein